MEQQTHSKRLEMYGKGVNCLKNHGAVWTCLEQSGNVWNNWDEFGKDVRSQTYVEQASGHARKCVEKAMNCLDKSWNVWKMLKQFLNVSRCLGKLGDV